jgi:hypothetical protein
MDDRTLGDLERDGSMPAVAAAEYASWFGDGWCDVLVSEAVKSHPGMDARSGQDIAALEERLRIVEALRARVARGGKLGDELVGEVVADLYGANPPAGAIEAVLAVVENVSRRKRGEPPADER